MHVLACHGAVRATPTGLAADLTQGRVLRIDLLEDWLLRIAIVPAEGMRVDRTWMVAPDGEVPWEGRPRLATEGFSLPAAATEVMPDGARLTGGGFEAELRGAPLKITLRHGGRLLFSDRDTGAYALDRRGRVLRHYQARKPGEFHYGLGDKTGPLDRSGRRFRLLQLDALGFDAEHADPLYKHAPWLVCDDAAGGAFGLFYDTLTEMAFDLGCEHSNYHEAYRSVEAWDDSLVTYVVAGPRVRDVVPRLAALTGRPHLPPRWAFGFAFTTMHHADAPDAQKVMTAFVERCRAEGIPLSALHSGSGYTTGPDGRRYVFTWNRSKFPDPEAFFRRLAELGLPSVANVKPVLLTEHPAYAMAAEKGLFARRADGAPVVEQFWGGPGSSLDFTNAETVRWWQDGLSRQVLDAGFTAGWNDNNEAEMFDEDASVEGFGRPLPAIDVRPLQALLMTRATFEATQARMPDRRPYTITRAGPIGLQRYAETWSGDNFSSWHTLKWNIRNGLAMSLSGWPFIGHDIGGFTGPKPEPELFLRFVQLMALHPRAVMNSWKPQEADPVNTPFMYPQVLPAVKEALTLRCRLMPLLYMLARRAHESGEPVIAPTFYHFDDAACRADADAFMLGPDVLVLPAVDPGARSVRAYLPDLAGGWHDLASGTFYPGGAVAVIEAPLERLPVLVREGAILPIATAWPDHAPHEASAVAATLFAGAADGAAEALLTFDDGVSWGFRQGRDSRVRVRARWGADGAEVTLTEEGSGHGRPALGIELRGPQRPLRAGTLPPG